MIGFRCITLDEKRKFKICSYRFVLIVVLLYQKKEWSKLVQFLISSIGFNFEASFWQGNLTYQTILMAIKQNKMNPFNRIVDMMYIVLFTVLHRYSNCVVKQGPHVSSFCLCNNGWRAHHAWWNCASPQVPTREAPPGAASPLLAL